jgi:hypothetical protein
MVMNPPIDSLVTEQRERLQHKLSDPTYQTLNRRWGQRLGVWLQKRTGAPQTPPLWYTTLVTALCGLAAGLLGTLWLSPARPTALQIGYWLISTLYIWVLQLVTEANIRRTMGLLRAHILIAMARSEDIESLEVWLRQSFDARRQFKWAMGFSVLIHVWFVALSPSIINEYGWPIIIANVILNLAHGVCVYFVFVYLAWAINHLSRYELELFSADPGSSETIYRLSLTLRDSMASLVFFIASITTFLALVRILPPLGGLVLIILMWVVAAVLFVSGQSIVSQLVTRAKWRTLNAIQAQIQELKQREAILSPDTLAHINKLLDYHDRILGRRGTLFDARVAFDAFRSLLLPTVGIVVANLNDIVKLLTNLGIDLTSWFR